MKILVRNLARMTTEENLGALFAPFGDVQFCNLVLDKHSGASKGFGFVEMPKAGAAKAAIKALNNTVVDGVKIRVKLAQTKDDASQNPASQPPTSQAPTKRSGETT